MLVWLGCRQFFAAVLTRYLTSSYTRDMTMISLGQLLNPQQPFHGQGHSRAADTDSSSDRHAVGQGHAHGRHRSHGIQEIQQAQVTLEQRLSVQMNTQMAQIQPEAAAMLGAPPEAGYEADDFSPEAVTDRIMGFIEGRIDAARADGASDEEIESMFGQAMKGLEQGLKEAKEIITSMDMFDGEVKDNFFATVSMLDERMLALEKSIHGEEAGEGATTGDASGTSGLPEPAGGLNIQEALSSLPRGNERYAAQANALFFSEDSQFDMKVTTQDGDVVTIQVGAGQSIDYQSGAIATPRGSVSGYELAQSSYYDLSFSVEGDLDEGELAALNDLFSQVNDIADSFYAGDVGAAFEQALSVGYDGEELAGFAVNMTHSEVVAVAAYQEVATLAEAPVENPLQGMMDKLSDFASRVLNAQENLLANPATPQSALGDLLAELVPPEEKKAEEAPADSPAQSIHNAFRSFIDGILG